MEAAERTVSKILTEQIRYEIPSYQRPYSWEKGNVEQLLDDVWEAYEDEDEEYFIGSLITIEKERDSYYDVVDGQQRLTTLNLIFARLRDYIEDDFAKSELGKRVLPKNALTGEEATPRLRLRDRDQSFFRRHVLSGEPVTGSIMKEIEHAQDAPKLRIAENIAAVDTFLEGKDQQTLKMFANYLLTKVYVVFVTTASFHSAYRLFNVLNARGMPLSNADLIKNMLFARIGGDEVSGQELEQRWLELEEIVSIEKLDQFLAHHRTTLVAEKARKSLHEEFEPLIKSTKSPLGFLEQVIASARNYVRIHEVAFEIAGARRALLSLHRVAFEEWIPPLLAFLNQPVQDMQEGDFIDRLERITYQNWIRRLSHTARLTVYFRLISAINAKRSSGEVYKIFSENAQNDEFRTLLDGEVYGKPFAKAVLLRLEESEQDESVTKDFSGRITIEHVMPQALKEKYWQDRFSDDRHRYWVHRLGNLALLQGTKNYKAQYYDFDRKKGIYAERNNKVSFDTTKNIINEDEWTEEKISLRQVLMMDNAARVWSLQ